MRGRWIFVPFLVLLILRGTFLFFLILETFFIFIRYTEAPVLRAALLYEYACICCYYCGAADDASARAILSTAAEHVLYADLAG